MADTKISQLPTYPSGTSPISTDILPIVDTSQATYVTRQITWGDINGGSAQISVVPYALFRGSVAGGDNQTFTDAALLLFDNIGQSTIVVDGIVLTPNENYTIVGAQLTITDYLPPLAEIEVIYKVIPLSTVVNDIVLQNGTDNLVDQLNNPLITQ